MKPTNAVAYTPCAWPASSPPPACEHGEGKKDEHGADERSNTAEEGQEEDERANTRTHKVRHVAGTAAVCALPPVQKHPRMWRMRVAAREEEEEEEGV